MKELIVKRERTGPVKCFHPWVFSGALKTVPEGMSSGDPVRLVDEGGRFLASGYFNSYSQIAVRLWSRDPNDTPDRAFFQNRIRGALGLRLSAIDTSRTDSFRVVNGESDLLPGLILDKYANHAVLQFHTKGIERWRDDVLAALIDVLSPKGVVERSDIATRKNDLFVGGNNVIHGDVPDRVTIMENGLRFLVDLKGGQKTGFFLDQRDKRQALVKYCKDADLLNCFSYTGAFGVYALSGGARRVTSVDVSKDALELARENILLNGFDPGVCEFVADDAKRYLRNAPRDTYDVIVLDPPAFIKDRRKKKEGIVGYRGINESALGALKVYGVMVTCSCSTHLSELEFRYLISEAGCALGRPLRILESFTHGVDHCRLVPFTEGDYLKCLILKA